MNDDLISRSALKKEVDSWGCDSDKYDFIDAINNAPTVEPTFGLFKKMLCAECDKRAQGEWIMDNVHTNNPLLWYKCNLCGVYHSPTNFCPNCGADMRGEKNVQKT